MALDLKKKKTFEITINSHLFVRNNTDRFCIPFIQFPLMIHLANCNTVLQQKKLTLIKSTDIFQIFPILLVLICVFMCVSKAECRRIDTFKLSCRRRLLSSLDSKEMKPVNPRGNQSWIFIGKTDAEAEAPILWPSVAKNWLIGKKSWCWGRLKGGREGWGGWMASLTRWAWVWASSESWTGKLGMLQSMG